MGGRVFPSHSSNSALRIIRFHSCTPALFLSDDHHLDYYGARIQHVNPYSFVSQRVGSKTILTLHALS